jgi:pyridoxamine 5'-phosphate oxidase
METKEILGELESVLESAKVGLLATVDGEGRPAMRWMTPAVMRGRPASLYAVTSPNFRKVVHLQANPKVEWQFQTRDLNRVLNLKGNVRIIDNPSLKSEVMEAIGDRLQIFWRVNVETDFVVLETQIQEITVFYPMQKRKETVSFGAGDSG